MAAKYGPRKGGVPPWVEEEPTQTSSPRPRLRIRGGGDRCVDLTREGVDCVFRVGDLAGGDLVARRLATPEEAACAASPAHLARATASRSACTPWTTGTAWWASVRRRPARCCRWSPTAAAGRATPLRLRAPPWAVTVGGAETCAAAARAGLGPIQAPRYRPEEDSRRGALVPVLEATPPTPTPVSVAHPRAEHLSPRLRVLMDRPAERFRSRAAAAAAGLVGVRFPPRPRENTEP